MPNASADTSVTSSSTQWLAGTSGYSYKEWRGTFYPPEMTDRAMLPYYAVQLPAVEINNTFYRMPRTHVLEGWHDAVGPDFRFIIKASRRITHQLRLNDAAEPVSYLVGKLDALGDKLGAVLFQLPPFMRKDLDRLRGFLDILPRTLPAAFEFRHVSWFDDDVFDALAEHDRGLCISDDGKLALPPRTTTTRWAYLRLRQSEYSDASLKEWLSRVQEAGADTGYAFFKHEQAGAGPVLAQRFLDLASDRTVARPPQRAARRGAASKRQTRS